MANIFFKEHYPPCLLYNLLQWDTVLCDVMYNTMYTILYNLIYTVLYAIMLPVLHTIQYKDVQVPSRTGLLYIILKTVQYTVLHILVYIFINSVPGSAHKSVQEQFILKLSAQYIAWGQIPLTGKEVFLVEKANYAWHFNICVHYSIQYSKQYSVLSILNY